MTSSNQNKGISDSQLRTTHNCAKQFMTVERFQELTKEKQGTILVGVFAEDFTDSAIALAQSFPEYQEDTPLFEHHWGYIRNRVTEQQLTGIIIPDLRVRLNQELKNISSDNKVLLAGLAKAYMLCNTRLVELSSSK
jgi:hypothetical protein